MVSAPSVFALSISLLSAATASHVVNVYNYCGEAKRGHVKSGSFNYVSSLLPTNGGRQTVTLDERASSFIVFGESGECPGDDGPGCTRLECDFHDPNFQQVRVHVYMTAVQIKLTLHSAISLVLRVGASLSLGPKAMVAALAGTAPVPALAPPTVGFRELTMDGVVPKRARITKGTFLFPNPKMGEPLQDAFAV
ncbi:hypothetical protein BT69DRAFT_1394789 [Atractiella rhizophila]|nr:hypothetical protein BT69DRAFT_1394789 [Atractiella rhizophila]